MDIKGTVLIKNEFKFTTRWPSPQFTLNGFVDLEKEYKEGLIGRSVHVMDIAVDGSSYLVLGHTKDGGAFIWDIDKKDTHGFLPIKKVNGEIVPAGLSPIEEFAWIMSKKV